MPRQGPLEPLTSFRFSRCFRMPVIELLNFGREHSYLLKMSGRPLNDAHVHLELPILTKEKDTRKLSIDAVSLDDNFAATCGMQHI